MTTDQLITELIAEIRSDRGAATKRDERITAELRKLNTIVGKLGTDFEAFRTHMLEHADKEGRHLRMVAAHAGVTDPRDGNGR